MTNVTRLCELGMVPQVATEAVAQFTAATGNARRLMELSVPEKLASEIAAQAGGTKNVNRLIECGMVPALAAELIS